MKINVMRYLMLLGIVVLLQSCGSNLFTKRKYTKGVYVAKHSHGKSRPLKKHKIGKKKDSKNKDFHEEHSVQQEIVKEVEPVSKKENQTESNRFNTKSLPIDNIVIDEPQILNNEFTVHVIDDSEEPKKNKTFINLGQTSAIIGGVAFGLIAGSMTIVWLGVSGYLVANVFGILAGGFFIIAVVLAIVALVKGANSYKQIHNKNAIAGIVFGALVLGAILISVLAVSLILVIG